jgi:hypothetical protein
MFPMCQLSSSTLASAAAMPPRRGKGTAVAVGTPETVRRVVAGVSERLAHGSQQPAAALSARTRRATHDLQRCVVG